MKKIISPPSPKKLKGKKARHLVHAWAFPFDA